MTSDDGRGSDPPTTRAYERRTEALLQSDPARRQRADARLARRLPRVQVRQDGLWPFLLVRDFVGDDGRPRPTRDLRQSPDVLLLDGNVADTSAGPLTFRPRRNMAHTVFVHVWNLGRLPAVGATLTVMAVNASAAAGQPPPPVFVGAVYFDLPDRRQPDCHRIVRPTAPFVASFPVGATVRLVAKVSHLLDLGGPALQARADRHEAEIRVTVQA